MMQGGGRPNSHQLRNHEKKTTQPGPGMLRGREESYPWKKKGTLGFLRVHEATTYTRGCGNLEPVQEGVRKWGCRYQTQEFWARNWPKRSRTWARCSEGKGAGSSAPRGESGPEGGAAEGEALTSAWSPPSLHLLVSVFLPFLPLIPLASQDFSLHLN